MDLVVAKALSENGSGEDSTVADAIDWCVDQGVQIISLSLGGAPGLIPFNPFSGRDSSDAASDAIDLGIVVIAAAGNDGNPETSVSNCKIGALRPRDQPMAFCS